MALELLAEIDIFEDPHKGDTDYYQPSDDGRDEGGDGARNMVDHCGEPLTDADLRDLDPHKKAILVKQITTRVHETLHAFDESSHDEMADLKAIEDQSSRAQVTKLIREQEVRSKKIQELIVSSSGDNTMNLQEDARWAEEEGHIIEEQQLLAVEVQNSEEQVNQLLQLCTETTEGASARLEAILAQLEAEIEVMRRRALRQVEDFSSQAHTKEDIAHTQLETLRELLSKAEEEKNALSGSQVDTKDRLETLQENLNSLREKVILTNEKVNKERARAEHAEERARKMDDTLETLSEESARLKRQLQGVEAIKSERKRLKETEAKLAVAEKRVATLTTNCTALTEEIKSMSAEVDKQRRLLGSLEDRLDEEKSKTSSMTARQNEQAKETANLGADAGRRFDEFKKETTEKFQGQIFDLKAKAETERRELQGKVEALRSQLAGSRRAEEELRKQNTRLRTSEIDGESTIRKGGMQTKLNAEVIASLTAQRDQLQRDVEGMRESQRAALLENGQGPGGTGLVSSLRAEVERLQVVLKEAQQNCGTVQRRYIELMQKHESLDETNQSERVDAQQTEKRREEEDTTRVTASQVAASRIEMLEMQVRQYQRMMSKLGVVPLPKVVPHGAAGAGAGAGAGTGVSSSGTESRPENDDDIESDGSFGDDYGEFVERRQAEGQKSYTSSPNSMLGDVEESKFDATEYAEAAVGYVDRAVSPFFSSEAQANYVLDVDDFLIDTEYQNADDEPQDQDDLKDTNLEKHRGRRRRRGRNSDSIGSSSSSSSSSSSRTTTTTTRDNNNDSSDTQKGDAVVRGAETTTTSGQTARTTSRQRKKRQSRGGSRPNYRFLGVSRDGAQFSPINTLRAKSGKSSRASDRDRERRQGHGRARSRHGNGGDGDPYSIRSWQESRSRDRAATPYGIMSKKSRGVSTRAELDQEETVLGIPRVRLPPQHFINLSSDKDFSQLGDSELDAGSYDDEERADRIRIMAESMQAAGINMLVESGTQTDHAGAIASHSYGGSGGGGTFLLGIGKSAEVEHAALIAAVREKEAALWQDRVWELQQITYLMDTLVPAREFYRTRAGIGSTAEGSIRYYTKPNTAPPPMQATQDLLWLLQRDICASRAQQAQDNWEYMRMRLELKRSQDLLRKDRSNLEARIRMRAREDAEDAQRRHEEEEEEGKEQQDSGGGDASSVQGKQIVAGETRKWQQDSDRDATIGLCNIIEKWHRQGRSSEQVWKGRRQMYIAQRQRRWKQTLDACTTLSNYANGKNQIVPHQPESAAATNTVFASKASSLDWCVLPHGTEYVMSMSQNMAHTENTDGLSALEVLKTMVPFLPENLKEMGVPRAAKLLLEITKCVAPPVPLVAATAGPGAGAGPTAASLVHPNVEKTASSDASTAVESSGTSNRAQNPSVALPYRDVDNSGTRTKSTSMRVIKTPYLQRKEEEWWNSKANAPASTAFMGTGGKTMRGRRTVASSRTPRRGYGSARHAPRRPIDRSIEGVKRTTRPQLFPTSLPSMR